jgi:hypothetical protein
MPVNSSNRRFELFKIKFVPVFLAVIILATTAAGCASKKDVAALQKDYDMLKTNYDTAANNLASAQREYATLQASKDALQKDSDATKASLQTQISSQSASIASLQGTNASLQSNLTAATNTQIRVYYSFKYQTTTFNWDLSIPLSEFLYYKDKTRATDNSKYSAMVSDSHGDAILNVLVQKVKDASLANNLKKTDTVDLVGAFIQSLQHSNQDTATPYDDHALYPIETLFQQGGDCEDNSILAAALLQRLEYNQVFFVFSQPKHIALGIDVPTSLYTNGWEYQAKKYTYLETTGHNYPLGSAPAVYTTLQPEIIVIVK